MILSGGGTSGSTSGYHHAITIDEKSRAIKRSNDTKQTGTGGFFRRHRGVTIALVLVAALIAVFAVDGALTQNRIYPGVRIGALDVGGKTEMEASALLAQAYGDQVADASAVIFASEDEARNYLTDGVLSVKERDGRREELEDAAADGRLWLADAESLGLTLPADELAAEALAVGRDNGGALTRLATLFSAYEIALRADYSLSAFEKLATAIEASTGQARKEYSVTVQNGQASVVTGQDGYRVDRGVLDAGLNAAIFNADVAGVGVLAVPEFGAITVDEAQAAALADKINEALGHALVFTYGDAEIKPTRADVGAWVRVNIYNPESGAVGSGDALKASLDTDAADLFIAKAVHPLIKDSYELTFESQGGVIEANVSEGAPLPGINEAVETLNKGLFNLDVRGASSEKETQVQESPDYPATVTVPIAEGRAPTRLSFDEAAQSGLIVPISSYTTDYLSTSTNRVINIHRAADYLNRSIVNPGQTWSFLKVVGDPNAERGFVGAGVIMANEHQDAVGGGVCQVATTVFNAVYDAGYPITRRYNHSLYISSYPDGRDAAVAYPDLDLQWQNDTTSGILMGASYTDSSLTITLYGVDPGYSVKTEVGQWKPGKTYSSVTKTDSSLGAGQSYIESYGQDGRSITVTRTVTDEGGDLKSTDVFYSEYQPVDQVTRVGQ